MNKKLLRKKLALMLANLKKKRKYYTEVEYLESTGTQYIDTGILPSKDLRTKVVQAYTGTSIAKNSSILGSNGNGNLRYWINYDNHFEIGYGNFWETNVVVQPDEVNTIDFNYIKNGSHYFNFNGTEYKRTGTPNTQYSIVLFGRVVSTQSPILTAQRIYRVQFIRNDVLIGDFIPVLDWDMTPCMFDKISGQLFYNAGTGDFVAGREIHYVDYLESTGTQYIDTGYKPVPATTKFEFYFSPTNITGNYFPFGARHNTSIGAETCTTYFSTGNIRQDWAGLNTYFPKINVGDKVLYSAYNNTVSLNDNSVTGTVVRSTTRLDYNFLLFTVNTNGTADTRRYVGKVYYAKLWDNGVLVRDFIPAIDENGTAFMFDRVSHTCFLNAGQGSFKYPAREVEYLQSDGARAIVAGVTVDDTCGYDVKWMALNAYDRIIMGTKGSGDSRWVLSGNNNLNINLSWNTMYGSNGLGLNKIQTAQMNYFNDRKRILNGIPLADITTPLASAASTYSVGIFGGYWGASTIILYSTCRIYYAKISKGTELIRDFIPMVKDGSPCLYDKVGGEYYFGTGTGTFTRGKIVEPEYE